jgi:hypothetical protein
VRRPAGCNSDGTVTARVGVPTMSGAVAGCGGRPRRAAGGSGRAGPMGRQHRPHPANRGTPPYDARGWDSSNLSHATRPDHFRQNRRDIPRSGNGPFLFKRRVPGKKFVIAAADCGFLDRLSWRILVSPFTAIGIRQRPRGDMLGNEPMDSSLACIRARDAVPGTGARCRAKRRL